MAADLKRREDVGQRLYGRVFSHIREQLVDGTLGVGDRLAPERELAAILGVSRPVVREVLRAFAALGVIEIRHGYGSVVRKPEFSELGDLFAMMLAQYRDVAEDVMEARVAIERQAIRLAAQRATPADLRLLDAALARIEATIDDPDSGADADHAFHAALIAASGSPTLVSLHATISALLRQSHLRRRRDTLGIAGLPAYLVAHHRLLVDAVKARDPVLADDLLTRHFAIGPGTRPVPAEIGEPELRA